MNNLRLFTNDKQIDTRSTSNLRAVLLKISLQKMNASVFKFCQYVFLSYAQSIDQQDKCSDLNSKAELVMDINSTAHVFDQELLINVLGYLKSIDSSIQQYSTSGKTKDSQILSLATALMKHSKHLEHKNTSGEKVNLLTF